MLINPRLYITPNWKTQPTCVMNVLRKVESFACCNISVLEGCGLTDPGLRIQLSLSDSPFLLPCSLLGGWIPWCTKGQVCANPKDQQELENFLLLVFLLVDSGGGCLWCWEKAGRQWWDCSRAHEKGRVVTLIFTQIKLYLQPQQEHLQNLQTWLKWRTSMPKGSE